MEEMDATQYKELFRTTYMGFLTQGMTPNDAVTATLQALQHITPIQEEENAAAGTTASPSSVDEVPNNSVTDSTAVATSNLSNQDENKQEEHEDVKMEDIMLENTMTTADEPIVQSSTPASPTGPPLAERLHFALQQALITNDYREVKMQVYQIFSDIEMLNIAFVRAQGELDIEAMKYWGVDRALVAEVYNLLGQAFSQASGGQGEALQNTMLNALATLVTQPWNFCSTWTHASNLRFFLVVFDHPSLFDPDYLNVVGGLCKLFYHAPASAKMLLRTQWNTFFTNDELYRLLELLQQAITVCLYGSRKLDIVYAVCNVLNELYIINNERQEPFASREDFYNDAVNSEVDIVQDYTRSIIFHKKKAALLAMTSDHDEAAAMNIPHRLLSELSFCDFPFVLDAGSKSRVLQIDSDLEQRTRVQDAVLSRSALGLVSPFLVLQVRRENIIEDALQQLVRVSPETLKKPLKVKFIGEEGIDEGGVQKEFFQILIRKLLDPAFGMFTYDEETRTLWFNSDSLEATMEFELIGILLGVAIYNSVILDVHFPHIVYKKLMGRPLDLHDVEIAMPTLGKGLRQLLTFDGNVEEVFMRNFEYSYEIFGEVKTVELKPGGRDIPVTNVNREEYVSLYVDYILNTSVARQYGAFHRGFHLVCNSEVLQMFQWEELNLLICGSEDLDFEALEEATRYDDGYTAESECIKNFWSVVHELPLEDKKKLLMFATGSDRVPIRGLSNLVFIISRNGSDSDRLPTAHTCFNHLLLPEYATREKLKNRLLLAINQAEGFGLR